MAKRRRHQAAASAAAAAATSAMVVLGGGDVALALPEGMVVTGGQLELQQSDANNAQILQGSQRAAADFNSFNIDAGQRVQIKQPNAASLFLGRVTNGQITQIHGQLDANGRVVLVNPAGLIVGPGGVVNAAAFTATTLHVDPQRFMQGGVVELKALPGSDPNAAVINHGRITVNGGGFAALLAPQVVNHGVITAKLGQVQLASGTAATLDISGDGLLSVALDPAVAGSITANGTIKASHVRIGGGEAAALAAATVQLGGVIQARSNAELLGSGGRITVEGEHISVTSTAVLDATGPAGGGQILVGGSWQNSDPAVRQATTTTVEAGAVLDASATAKGHGGTVVAWSDITNPASVTRVAGSLRAEGGPNGGDGGRLEASGALLQVDGINVSTLAPMGRNGLWLLDPTTVNITSSSTTGSLAGDLANAGVTSIKATDIQNAINAGNNVSIVASDTITLSSNLAFAVSPTNTTPTLTLDNRSGSKKTITTSGSVATISDTTTASGSSVNISMLSAGGSILLPNSNGATGLTLNIKGHLLLDNTFAVGGTTSGFINSANATTYAIGTASGIGLGYYQSITAKSITMKGVSSASTNQTAGVYIGAGTGTSLTATGGDINLNGVLRTASAISGSSVFGTRVDGNVTANSGAIVIYGSIDSAVSIDTLGNGFYTLANNTFSAKRIQIIGEATSNAYGIFTQNAAGGPTFNVVASSDYASGGTAISLTGNKSSGGNGIYLTQAAITNNAGGGDVKLMSNSAIYQGGSITLSANTSSAAQNVVFDTRSGNQNASIREGALTINTTGATSAVNYSVLTDGAPITISGARTIPGYIQYDNTCLSCTTAGVSDLTAATATSSNTTASVGITVSGNQSAGSFAGTGNSIRINGINASNTSAAVSLGTSTLTLGANSSFSGGGTAISITGTKNTANIGLTGISSTGAIAQNASGGDVLFQSNGGINQSGAITMAANTSGTASSVIYDTTLGNKTALISSGSLTITSGSTSAINYIQKSAGTALTVGATSVPGIITLDNTWGCSGAGCTVASDYLKYSTITSTNTTASNGITINGALTAANLTNAATAITIKGATSAASTAVIANASGVISASQGAIAITGSQGVGNTGGAAINLVGVSTTSGNISISGASQWGNGVTLNGNVLAQSGSITINGASNAAAGTASSGVYIAGTISASANVDLIGRTNATNTNGGGIFTAPAGNVLAGGNVTMSAYNRSNMGLILGNVVYAGGNLNTYNATIPDATTGMAVSDTSKGATTAQNGYAYGVWVRASQAASTISVGPNQGTYTGLRVIGTANIWGRSDDSAAPPSANYGVYIANSFSAGTLNITGTVSNSASVGVFMNTGTLTSTSGGITITGTALTNSAINLNGSLLASANGINLSGTSTAASTVVNGSGAWTNTAGSITVTGNNASGGSSTGINLTGAITQNANGGNVTFTSNNKINQTGAVTVAPNTSSTTSGVTYDTTTGTKDSTITSGALSVTTGSTKAINYTQKTAGAAISTGAISVPGFIELDNTYGAASGAPATGYITAANANTLATTAAGITVGGNLSVGTVAQAGNAIRIKGVNVSASSAAVALGASTLTINSASTYSGSSDNAISIIGLKDSANIGKAGITTSGAINQNASGGNILFLSNGTISQSGTVTIAANTRTSTASSITYDTTSGNKDSIITVGNVTVSGTSTSAVNYIQKSAGAALTTPTLTIPGSITIDNTWGCTGASCTVASGYLNYSTITTSNTTVSNGIYITKALNAANIGSDAYAITIKGVSAQAPDAVYQSVGGPIASTGATGGDILISGAAPNGTSMTYGVSLYGAVTAASGNLTVQGVGGVGTTSGGGGVYIGNVAITSSLGDITISGSSPTATAGGQPYGVIANGQLSAKNNLTLIGYNASSSAILGAIFTPGSAKLLAGGNIVAAASSNVGPGVYITATFYAGGNYNTYNATIDPTTKVAAVDTSTATTTSSGTAVKIAATTTPVTINSGPNTGTFTGIRVAGTATIWGQATSTAASNGIGVDAGAPISAGTLNITGTVAGTAGSKGINQATGTTLTTTSGGVTIMGTSNAGMAIDMAGAINSAAGITLTGTTTATNAATVVNGAVNFTNASGDIIVTGNTATGGSYTGDKLGINLTGTFAQNANGGNVHFISNNKINQSGNVTIAANTSSANSEILYDTSRGNRLSLINAGAVTFSGSSTKLINYSNIASGAQLIVNSALNVPGAITFDNTYGGTAGPRGSPASGFITSANAWSLATTTTGGGIPVTASLTAKAGIYLRGAVGASSLTANQTTDAVSIINATSGTTLSLSTTGSFTAGQDAISIVGITPQFVAAAATTAGTNKGNAIQITGSGNVSVANNSTRGNTTITAYTGRYNDIVSITNAATAGAIAVSAIGTSADILTVAGTTFTQNSNSGVYLATSNNGNITPPKIINNGTGNVVIGAGAYLPVGTVSTACTTTGCGQITGLNTNTITSPTGRVYLYAGSPGSTAGSTTTNLGALDSSLATLSFSNTVFSQAYETGNVPATNLPDYSPNTGNAPAGIAPVVQFRITPSYQMVLSRNLSKVYGSDDPANTLNSVTTAGTLQYELAQAFTTPATNPTRLRDNGGTTEIILSVNGTNFYIPLNSFLNSISGTRSGTALVSGQQAYTMPTSGSYDANYGYSFTSAMGVLTTSGVLVSSTVGANPVGLSITPKTLTIAATNQSKAAGTTFTPDGTNQFIATGLVSSVNGLYLGDAVSSVTLNSPGYSSSAVKGTHSITPSNAVFGTGTASNYTINYTDGTLTATGIPLTITALADTKIYGNSSTTLGVTYNTSTSGVATTSGGMGYSVSGLQGGDSFTGLTLTSSGGAVAANVGSYTIIPSAAVISGSNAANYDITYSNGQLTVNPRSITIAASQVTSTYGSAEALSQTAYNVSNGTLASGDAITALSIKYNSGASGFVPTTAVPGTVNAGTYNGVIIPSGASGTGGFNTSNYSVSYANGNLTVNPLALTITASPQSTTYGTALALGSTAYTTNVGALPNGDTISALTLKTNNATTVAAGTNAGSYSIVASGASVGSVPGNYSVTYANSTLTVNPAVVSVVANKIYDGTTAFTVGTSGTSFTVTGIGSETLTMTAGTGAANSANVVGVSSLNTSGYTLGNGSGGGLASNYVLPASTAAVTITPKQLTASLVGTPTKTYDTTTAATLTAGTNTAATTTSTVTSGSYALDGFVVGQGAYVTQTSGTYNSANASDNTLASTRATTVSTTLGSSNFVAIGSTSLSNYSLPTAASGTGSISRAALSVSANPVTLFSGETAVYSSTSSGLLGGQSVSVSYTVGGSAAPANPTTSGTITPVVASDAVSQNYQITVNTAALSVASNLDLLITGGTTTSSYGTLSSSSNLSAALNPLVRYCDAPTGTACSGTAIRTFTVTAPTGSSTAWTAKDVSGTDATNSIYTFNLNVGSAVYSTGGNYLNAGNYTSTPSNATQNAGGTLSPRATYYNAGTLTVTPATVTPTNTTAPSKTYDATTVITTPLALAVTPLTNDTAPTITGTGAYNSKNVGTTGYTISNLSLSGSNAGNYVLSTTSLTGTNGTITPAPLSVGGLAANNKVYDATSDATIATTNQKLVGVLASDVVSISSTGALAGTFRNSDNTARSNVGTGLTVTANSLSGITLSGADAGNYTVTSVSGALSANITPKPVTLTGTRQYNGSTSFAAASLSVSTGITGQSLTLAAGGTATANSANVDVAQTLTNVTGLTLADGTGGLASNYTLSGSQSTVSITAAPITVSAADVSKVYDGSLAVASATPTVTTGTLYSNASNGGVLDALVGGVFAYTSTGAGNGNKTVTVTGVTVDDGNSGRNYNITFANNTTSTITPAPLTIQANNVTSTYGTATTLSQTAYTISSGVLVTGDAISAVAINYSGSSTTTVPGTVNAGSYSNAIVPSNASGTGGFNSTNYTITYSNGALTVGKATLTLAPKQTTTTYDGTTLNTATYSTTTGNYTVSGYFNGDTSTLTLSGAMDFNGSAATTVKNAGTYTFSQGSLTASSSNNNYLVSWANPSNNTYVINKATASLTAGKTYDGSTGFSLSSPGSSYTVTGVGLETLSLTAFSGTANSANVTGVSSLTVGSYTLGNGTGGGLASNYVLPASTVSVTITPKQLTAAIVGNPTKTYDKSTTATLTAGTSTVTRPGTGLVRSGSFELAGFVGSEGAYVTKTAGSYDNANASLNSTAPATTVSTTLAGSDIVALSGSTLLSNYVLPTAASGAGTISQKSLTITGATTSQVYNAAVQTNATASVNGLVAGQSVTVTGYASRRNAGSRSDALVVTAGADTSLQNYAISTTNGALTITPYQLSLSGSPTATSPGLTAVANNKVYDGTRTATGSLTPVLFAGDTLSASASSATFDTKNVSALKTVTFAGLSLSGDPTTLANYAITSGGTITATAAITPAPLTVTGTTTSRTYSGSNQTNAAATVSGLISGESVTVSGYGTGLNVGSFNDALVVTANSGTLLSNYQVNSTNGALTITPAALTISGATSSQSYNGNTQVNAAATVSGLLGSDSITISGYGAGRNVGTYTDALVATASASTSLSNYTIAITNGALSIAPYQLNVGPNATGPRLVGNPSNKVYDATTAAAGGLSVQGLFGSDVLSAAATTLAFDSKDVGSAKTVSFSGITLGGDATTLANYSLGSTSAVTAIASITPAPLRVIVQNDAKFVTQTDAAGASTAPGGYNGYQFSGLVGGETAGVLGSPAISVSRSGISNPSVLGPSGLEAAGVYTNALTATGPANAGNYALSYEPGSFTIVPAGQLLVKTSGGSGVYGSGTVTPAISSVAYLNPSGNTLSTLTLASGPSGAGSYTYNDTAGGSVSFTLTPTGTAASTSGNTRVGSYAYSVTGLSVTGATNLSNTTNAAATGNLQITPKPASLSANSSTLTYNGALQQQATSFSGLIAGDLVSATGAASATHVGATASSLGVSGVDATNYSFSFNNGSLTITPKALSVSGAVTSQTYNGATQTNAVASVSGLVGSDSITVTGYGSGRNAGTYADALVLTPGGSTSLGNYQINTTKGSLTITPYLMGFGPTASSGPRVLGTATNKVYDSTTAAAGSLSVTGLLGGDTLTAAASSINFDTKDQGSGKTVTFSGITLGGDATTLANYSLGSSPIVTASANITRAPLNVYVQNDAKFVTQTDAVGFNGYQFSGFVGSETASVLGSPAITISRSNSGTNAAGSYAGVLTASGPATANNYALTYLAGDFTIVPAGQLLVKTSGGSGVYGSSSFTPAITSVSYLDPTGNTISNLTGSGPNANGIYVYNDSASGSVSFWLTPTGTTASTSGNTNVGSYAYSVSNLTVLGTNLSDTTNAAATGNLQVTPRPATLTTTSASRVYNGTSQTLSSAFTGLISGDLVSATGVASGTNVGAYASSLAVTGSDTSNYTFAYSNGSLTITPFQLNLGGTPTPGSPGITLSANNKVYDGTTTATGTLTPVLFAGDTLAASASSISFSTKNVGSGKPVTFAGITLSGNATTLANYSVLNGASGAATAAITPAAVSVTGATTSNVYNGTTQTNAAATVTGLLGGDSVSIAGYAARRNVGTSSDALTVTANSGTLLSNYTLSTTNGALSITPYQLSLSGTPSASSPGLVASVNTKVYDGITAGSGTLTPVLFAGDSLSASANRISFDTKDVGSGKTVTFSGITLGGDATTLANYSLGSAPTVTANGTITPAALRVYVQNDAKFYSQTDAVGASTATGGYNGYQFSGFVAGETAAALGSYSITISRDGITTPSSLGPSNKEAAGTYTNALIASGLATYGNYALTYVPGSFTIVPAGQLLVKTSGGTGIYGSGAVTPTITSVAYMATSAGNPISNLTFDSGPGLDGVYTYKDGITNSVSFSLTPTGTTTSTSGNTNVGSYALAVTGLSQSGTNLDNNAVATGNLQVTPKPATLTANAISRTYNGTVQSQTSDFSGLVVDDIVRATGVAAAKNVGVYASSLGVSGTDASNYTFAFINAPLMITPFQLSFGGTPSAGSPGITAIANSKVYDGTTTATGTLTPVLFAGDTLTASASSINFNTAAMGSGKPVTFSGITLSGDATTLANYTLPTGVSASSTANIVAAALTITADAKTKMYGTNDPALTYAVTGLMAGDTASTVLTGSLGRALFGTLAGEQVGSYAISLGSLTANSDYLIQYTGANLTITPRTTWSGPGPWPGPGPTSTPLAITANNASKAFGTYDPALTYSVSGLVNVTLANGVVINDTAASALRGALTRAAGQLPGVYAIGRGSLATSNYEIYLIPGLLTITPIEITAAPIQEVILPLNTGQVQNNQVVSTIVGGDATPPSTSQNLGPQQPNFAVQTQRNERYSMGQSNLQIDPGKEVCLSPSGCGNQASLSTPNGGGLKIRGINEQSLLPSTDTLLKAADSVGKAMKTTQARLQTLARWLQSRR